MHRLWKKPNPKHQITNKFKMLISKFENEKVCFEFLPQDIEQLGRIQQQER